MFISQSYKGSVTDGQKTVLWLIATEILMMGKNFKSFPAMIVCICQEFSRTCQEVSQNGGVKFSLIRDQVHNFSSRKLQMEEWSFFFCSQGWSKLNL